MSGAPVAAEARLVQVVLIGDPLARLSALEEADRAQAVADLAADSRFAPIVTTASAAGAAPPVGPYMLRLGLFQGRLLFDIRTAADAPIVAVGLALGPFRRLVKDYRLLVESYAGAIAEGREVRIQVIDMGRRGLHDEGARLLLAQLAGKIAMDFATARRLFTLVCVLHQRH